MTVPDSPGTDDSNADGEPTDGGRADEPADPARADEQIDPARADEPADRGADGRRRAHEAVIEAPYPDADLAASVAAAIRLDAGDVQGDRSEASVSRDGDRVEVRLAADDPAALRAAKRTWFGQLETAERTAVIATGGEH